MTIDLILVKVKVLKSLLEAPILGLFFTKVLLIPAVDFFKFVIIQSYLAFFLDINLHVVLNEIALNEIYTASLIHNIMLRKWK